MTRVYDSIIGAIDQKMLTTAASVLKEEEAKVASAVKVIVPMHLSAFMNKGNDDHVAEVIKEAGKLQVFKKKAQIFEGSAIIDGVNIGERFENALIGRYNSDFPKAVAAETGISPESADRLSNWVSAIVAGYFGEQMKAKKTLSALLLEVVDEKDMIYAALPASIASLLNIEQPKKFGNKGPNENMEEVCSEEHPACEKKMKNNWIWWSLLIILAVVLAILWFSSYRNEQSLNKLHDKAEASLVSPDGREKVILPLGDGNSILVYKGSCEDVIVEFLNSKEYKKATSEQLRYKWFNLERIDFVYNSPDDLLPGSMEQIVNVAAILKHYPKVKVDIGGYADRRGTQEVNLEMSLERAEFVKWILVDQGVSADRITTHGYGSDLAKVDADAPESERAADRTIAIRFVK